MTSRSIPFLYWLAVFAGLRLLSMYFLPMADSTEPRYAEIARVMAQTNDWITPWFTPDQPFWGKPPLSFWFQALSIKLFGDNDFAIRLPSWIAIALTLKIVWQVLVDTGHQQLINKSMLIFGSMGVVYLSAGAVMTDPFLLVGTTLSMASFYLVWHTPQASTFWRYGLFLGVAIGLLAKGPIAVVLTGGPLFIWLCTQHQWRWFLRAFPWFSGVALVLVLALPWYVLAELKTPGFLSYFIVGEHFMRFLDPGWGGDLYGTAHKHPKGMIWLQWLAASLPWGPLAVVLVIRQLLRKTKVASTLNSPFVRYLLLWSLFPLVFFTFSGNILWTYVLPGLPALAILIAGLLEHGSKRWTDNRVLWVSGLTPLFLMVLMGWTYVQPQAFPSEKALVDYVVENRPTETTPFYYFDEPPISARYYSPIPVQTTYSEPITRSLGEISGNFFVAIPKSWKSEFESLYTKPFTVLFENRRFFLVYLNSDTPDTNAKLDSK